MYWNNLKGHFKTVQSVDKEIFDIMVNRFRGLQLQKDISDNAVIPEHEYEMFKNIPYIVLVRPLILNDRLRKLSYQTLANRYHLSFDQIKRIVTNYGEDCHRT